MAAKNISLHERFERGLRLVRASVLVWNYRIHLSITVSQCHTPTPTSYSPTSHIVHLELFPFVDVNERQWVGWATRVSWKNFVIVWLDVAHLLSTGRVVQRFFFTLFQHIGTCSQIFSATLHALTSPHYRWKFLSVRVSIISSTSQRPLFVLNEAQVAECLLKLWIESVWIYRSHSDGVHEKQLKLSLEFGAQIFWSFIHSFPSN